MSEVCQAGSSGQRPRVVQVAPIGLRHYPLDGDLYLVKIIKTRGQVLLSSTLDGPPMRYHGCLRRFEARRFQIVSTLNN